MAVVRPMVMTVTMATYDSSRRAPTCNIFPLNLKRLTARCTLSITKPMGLRVSGSLEEMKLMRKLADNENEPQNIQVKVVEISDEEATIYLRGPCGTLVEARLQQCESEG